MSQPSSPSKSGWVQFSEEGGGDDSPERDRSKTATSQQRSPGNNSSSSGVSSARGSVNSIQEQQHKQQQDATLDVSDVQVVDERSIRVNSAVGNKSKKPEVAASDFRRMSSSAVSRTSHNSSSGAAGDAMDNVNLNDDSGVSASESNLAAVDGVANNGVIRGKHFQNGEVIVTLLPVNERFPWVTPARFRPELVPEELMAPVLTLTVEEYVQTMEKLTTHMRFTLYNICYKRILIIWIITAFTILLALLFSGFQGVQLFACGVVWLIMNASAIFFCMWIKLKLNKQLERCLASINAGLIKHKLVLGVDDRGKLSCHKVNLCFIYFDPANCVRKLESILAEDAAAATTNSNGAAAASAFDREAYLREVEQFEDVEVVVAGRNSVKLDRKHERAEKLFLHYIQRWCKDYLRRRLDWLVEDSYGRAEYAANTNPRHLRSALCPCQYIEEHLRNKRQAESLNPCSISANPCQWCN